jgi:hypothetical protein
MTQVFDCIDFKDHCGSVTIKTLTGKKINIIYNYEISTFESIFTNFLANYDHKQYSDYIDFYSDDLNRIIDKDEFTKTPQSLKIPLVSEIRLVRDRKTKEEVELHKQDAIIKEQLDKQIIESEKCSIGNITLFIKMIDGSTNCMRTNLDSSVSEIMLFVYSRISLLPSHQRLIHRGRQIDADAKISDYKISNESTIHLICRMRGGMFHETSGKNGDYKPLTDKIIWVDVGKEIKL